MFDEEYFKSEEFKEILDEYTNVFTSEDTLPTGKSVNDFKSFDFKRLIQDKAVEFANIVFENVCL